MPQITLKVNPRNQRIYQSYRRIGTGLPRDVAKLLRQAIEEAQRKMRQDPGPPPGYTREHGNDRNYIQAIKIADMEEMQATLEWRTQEWGRGRRREIGGFMGGGAEPGEQAWMHKNRWPEGYTVMSEAAEQLLKMVQNKITEYLDTD